MSNPRLSSPRHLSLMAVAAVVPLVLTGCFGGNRADVDAACADINAEISAVDLAAESIYTDLLVDDIPYQDEHAEVLANHLDTVEYLESVSRGDLRGDATERADAVSAVLDELDVGDEAGLEDAIGWVADTHDMILAACGY